MDCNCDKKNARTQRDERKIAGTGSPGGRRADWTHALAHCAASSQVGRTVDMRLLRLGHSARQAVGQAEPPPAPKLALGKRRRQISGQRGYCRPPTLASSVLVRLRSSYHRPKWTK